MASSAANKPVKRPPASDVLSPSFGRRLKQARSDQGLTLRELSDASGISITYLSDLEREKLENPSLRALRSIAKALGGSLNELIGVEGDEAAGGERRIPTALREFRQWPQFKDAIATEAQHRKTDPAQVEDEWLRALAAIAVGGKRPRTASDYMFVFEAARRAIGAT